MAKVDLANVFHCLVSHLEEQDDPVDAWMEDINNCHRHLKIKLIIRMRENLFSDKNTDFVDIFYGRNGANGDDFNSFHRFEDVPGMTPRPVKLGL